MNPRAAIYSLAARLQSRNFDRLLYKLPLLFKSSLHVTVAVTFRCNYYSLCPYCHLRDLGIPRLYKSDLPFQEFSSFLRILPSCLLDLTGGEPFLARRFKEFVKEVPKKHKIAVTTNLSFSLEEFSEVLGRFCHITASYHPHAVLRAFLDKLERLRSFNPNVRVNLVAHPSLLPNLREYLRIFKKRGIPTHIDPYIKPFFSPYRREERELVRGLLISRRVTKFPFRQEKRWCTAGKDHFFVAPNGDVYTCGQGMIWSHLLSLKDPYYLGNILEESFSPRREGTLCELPCCAGGDLDYVRWSKA
jgi:MoaA/NifB/PqqE/SkfB family radical SAM enzyme